MAWGALALTLSVACVGYAVWAFRRRRVGAGLRGVGVALIPLAAWLTGTLTMLAKVTDVVVTWATGVVWGPRVWVGLALLALALVLLVVARSLPTKPARSGPAQTAPAGSASARSGPAQAATRPAPIRRPKEGTVAQPGRPSAVDDEFADIEALLHKRGIT